MTQTAHSAPVTLTVVRMTLTQPVTAGQLALLKAKLTGTQLPGLRRTAAELGLTGTSKLGRPALIEAVLTEVGTRYGAQG